MCAPLACNSTSPDTEAGRVAWFVEVGRGLRSAETVVQERDGCVVCKGRAANRGPRAGAQVGPSKQAGRCRSTRGLCALAGYELTGFQSQAEMAHAQLLLLAQPSSTALSPAVLPHPKGGRADDQRQPRVATGATLCIQAPTPAACATTPCCTHRVRACTERQWMPTAPCFQLGPSHRSFNTTRAACALGESCNQLLASPGAARIGCNVPPSQSTVLAAAHRRSSPPSRAPYTASRATGPRSVICGRDSEPVSAKMLRASPKLARASPLPRCGRLAPARALSAPARSAEGKRS